MSKYSLHDIYISIPEIDIVCISFLTNTYSFIRMITYLIKKLTTTTKKNFSHNTESCNNIKETKEVLNKS